MTIDLLHHSICLIKWIFLTYFLPNFSTICSHMLSKFGKKSIQKSLIFSNKANDARGLINRNYLKLVLWTLISSTLLYGETTNCQDAKESIEGQEKEAKKENTQDKGSELKKEEEPPKIGNFSLPTSQQPAALFGFGGNIIDQGEVQLYFFADYFYGRKKIVSDAIPSVLFGITKELSIFFNFPVTPIMKDGRHTSSGFEDCFVQLEYAFYNKSTSAYVDQATVVANITVPTGSLKKIPPTGFGAPSFFLGATYYRTWVDWFVFVAPGAILTTSDHKSKFGDQFLYQFGLGKNIPSPKEWIYAWMIELDGQYSQKNRIDARVDPNSGGNLLWVTPSLWISSKKMLFQFGVSFPINQNLFGRQHTIDYALNLNFAWSFY